LCLNVHRAPSVIFLDEVDVLCQRRGSGSQQEQRVVAALLAELDALQDRRVMVLAATSRPDAIDESVRRPGRLDKEIELPVPGPDARR
jgi:SpoVK/Ycf46/Vps4 family AAA+-type ATPase